MAEHCTATQSTAEGIGASIEPLTRERQLLAIEASWESEALAAELMRLAAGSQYLAFRGMAARLRDLASVSMAILGDDMDSALAEAVEKLRGPAAKEASHG